MRGGSAYESIASPRCVSPGLAAYRVSHGRHGSSGGRGFRPQPYGGLPSVSWPPYHDTIVLVTMAWPYELPVRDWCDPMVRDLVERQRSRSCKLTRSRTYRQHQLSMVVICGDCASGASNSAFKKSARRLVRIFFLPTHPHLWRYRALTHPCDDHVPVTWERRTSASEPQVLSATYTYR